MHKFPPENAHRLESQERYQLLAPVATLQRFGLKPGMTVVDIGAGTGFFARAASEIAGNSGTVYAADTSDEMLGHLRRNGVPSNVVLVRSREHAVPLPNATADLIILAFVMHEIRERSRFLDEAARLLKDGGRILILDWKKQQEEQGPPEEERLDMNDLLRSLTKFAIVAQGDLNRSHYYIVAEQQPR